MHPIIESTESVTEFGESRPSEAFQSADSKESQKPPSGEILHLMNIFLCYLFVYSIDGNPVL